MPEESDARKSWMHWIDLLIAKILLASISVAVVFVGYRWSRDAKQRNLELLQRQVDNQIRATELQRMTSDSQVMSNMMPYLNCKHALSATAVEVVQHSAPDFALTAANALVRCANTPQEKAKIQQLRTSAQQGQIRIAFRRALANAGSYLAVGLEDEAVDEYRNAYANLPVDYAQFVDDAKAREALQALSEQRIHEAALLFEAAFKNVDLHQDSSISILRR